MQERYVQDRFTFRPLTLDDAPTILEHMQALHEEYHEQMRETIESIEEDIRTSWSDRESGKRYEYGVEHDGRLTGTITATPNEKHKRCELGYYLDPALWGSGTFRAMLTSFITCVFEEDYHKVYFRVRSDNERGLRALESFGAKREGIIRSYFYENGVGIDTHYFGILREEFETVSK